jgi:hypothetical protein
MAKIIITLIHELIHVYRRIHLIKYLFDDTPTFNMNGESFTDAGDAADLLIFGEVIENMFYERALFLLNVETWKKYSKIEEFQEDFKKIKRSRFSPLHPLKLDHNPTQFLGYCLNLLTRSDLANLIENNSKNE